MDVQSAANLNIPEGSVRNIHDKDKRLLWSAVGYNVRYDGDTTQQTYTGKNLIDFKLSNLNERNTSVTENNGIFTMTATSTNLPRVTISTTSSLVVGNTYTLSAYIRARSVTDGYTYMRMRETVSGGDWIPSAPSQQSISVSSDFVKYSLTFTATVSNPAIWFYLSSLASQTILADIDVKDVQIEAGSTATSYEPYVGGIPAPNPDYPQDVNVVKGVQDVKVTGKNLVCVNNSGSNHGITYTANGDGSLTMSGLSDGVSSYKITEVADYMHLKAGQVYTVSANNSVTNNDVTIRLTRSNGTVFNYGVKLNEINKTFTFTSSTDAEVSVEMRVPSGINLSSGFIVKPQVELGNQSTTWELYQGQTFLVDLGSIELCKIGDYQDYIYKSGDGWYVHKEIEKSELGNLTWGHANTNQTGIYRKITNSLQSVIKPSAINIIFSGVCSHFIAVRADSAGTYGANQGISVNTSGSLLIYYDVYNTNLNSDDAAFSTWLQNNDVTLYYALATPTDTKITDNTLISQLDAIHDWLTRYDYYGNVTGNLPMIINRTGLT